MRVDSHFHLRQYAPRQPLLRSAKAGIKLPFAGQGVLFVLRLEARFFAAAIGSPAGGVGAARVAADHAGPLGRAGGVRVAGGYGDGFALVILGGDRSGDGLFLDGGLFAVIATCA